MFIYRYGYVINTDEPANISYSGWVCEDGLDEIKAELEAINPPDGASPGGVTPTIVGIDRLRLFDEGHINDDVVTATDILDRCNDILDKCNDILEKVDE